MKRELDSMGDSEMIGREKEEKEKTNILFYRIDEHTYLDTNTTAVTFFCNFY